MQTLTQGTAYAYVESVRTPDQGRISVVSPVTDDMVQVEMANGDVWDVWVERDGYLYGEC